MRCQELAVAVERWAREAIREIGVVLIEYHTQRRVGPI